MKFKTTVLALATLALFTPTAYAQTGETLFEAKCAMCHSTTRPSDISTVIAPALMGVMRHVKMKYTSKEEAVNFVVEYALNPQKSKAVCTSDKIKRFGLMPSQKGNVSKEELQTIASWMDDNFPPKGFNGHGKGQGNGYGKNCQK